MVSAAISLLVTFLKRMMQRSWKRFENAWHRHHLSHRGSYSIEQMLALDDYRQHHSLIRVWAISLLLPVPTFAVSALIESIPLQTPSEGWKANHGFWVLYFLASLAISFGILIQSKEMVPAMDMTLSQIVLIALPSCFCTVAFHIAIASQWTFPVPFGFVLCLVFLIVLLIVFFIVVVGKEQYLKNPTLFRQLQDLFRVYILLSSLCFLYPGAGAIYNVLPPSYQPLFTLAFPLLKILTSNGVAFVTRDVERLPSITLMSVDVFNALFVAKCMQNAGSRMAYIAIFGFDLFESVMAYRSICSQVDVLCCRIRTKPNQTVAQRVLKFCFEPGVLNSRIRLRSLLKLKSTSTTTNIIEKLERLNHVSQEHTRDPPLRDNVAPNEHTEAIGPTIGKKNKLKQATKRQPTVIKSIFSITRHKVWPTAAMKVEPPVSLKNTDSRMLPLTLEEKQIAVENMLRILFQLEFHVLEEYVECIIPLLYSFHIMVLYHLPNVKYFTDMVNMTPAKLELTMLNIGTYALIEVLSFIVLHFALRRKLDISPACLLSFVLETHFFEFLGRLMAWYVTLLVFTLDHCGKRHNNDI